MGIKWRFHHSLSKIKDVFQIVHRITVEYLSYPSASILKTHKDALSFDCITSQDNDFEASSSFWKISSSLIKLLSIIRANARARCNLPGGYAAIQTVTTVFCMFTIAVTTRSANIQSRLLSAKSRSDTTESNYPL